MGSGMGTGMGMGSGSGMGSGMGQGTPMGDGQHGDAFGLLSSSHGSSGTSGAQAVPTPSGAQPPPETVMAEQIDTQPQIAGDGAIRVIAERTVADVPPALFQPLADKYAAIAEAAIRQADIPLTRRDYIERYFTALRNQDEAPTP